MEISDVAGEEERCRGGKFLTFQLHGEEYGLEILKVREIIGLMEITSVPNAPQFIRGVINLRGKVIPVIDLRRKFLLERADYGARTCIIVVDVRGIQMGIVVDSVSEVVQIDGEMIEETPDFGTKLDTDFILGMGKVGDRVKILLDIGRVLNDGELETTEKIH